MSLPSEKKFYDGFAEFWDNQFVSKAGRNFRLRKLAFLRDCLKDVSGLCLDVGCATGWFTKRLNREDLKVVGVDVSDGMVKYASGKYSDLQFVVSSAEQLSKHFNNVDCVFMMGVLTLEQANRILAECYKTLREGGKLVVVLGNGDNFYLKFFYDLLYPSLPARLSNVNELVRVLEVNGFRVTKKYVFHMVPFMIPDWLFGFVKFVEGKLEQTFLVNYFGSIIGVEAVKE